MNAVSHPVSKLGLDFEERNWEAARQKFKANHTDSDPKKVNAFLSERISIRDAKAACKEAQSKAKEQYSPALGGLFQKIEVAMKVGDLAIKSAPESVGLAWAGIRLCLHSIEDDFATFSLFSSACHDIVGILISCGVYGQMYGGPKGPESFQELHDRVVEYIPDIYCSILEFSYAMKKHVGRSKLERIGRGVVASSSVRFQAQIQSIQAGEAKMKEYAREATERLSIYYHEQGLENQGSMMNQLVVIQETMQSYVKVNEAFADKIRQLEEERKAMKKKTPQDIANEIFEGNQNALNPSSDQKSIFGEKIGRREANTCTWIFDLETYRKWHDSTESSILWVSGNGGYGKSILMSAVIEQLEAELKAKEHSIVHYFFCGTGDESTQKSKRIQEHLLFELYAQSKDSMELLEKANNIVSKFVKKKADSGPGQVDAPKDSITFDEAYSSLAKLLGKKVYLVIDAVDECNDRETLGFLKSIRSTTGHAGVDIKIVICSRPETDITTDLDGVPQIKIEENNGPDIRQNATSELKKLPGWTAAERDLACREIVKKAGSYFRYVELAIKFLRQPWQRPLENRLKDLPEGLDNSYLQILQQTDPNYLGLLKTCLTWTILADREVNVSEVVDAYSRPFIATVEELEGGAREDEDPPDDSAEGTNDSLYIDQIRFAGSSFLEVDSESKSISLRHNTVADYFLKEHTLPSNTDGDAEELCPKCRSKHGSSEPFTITAKTGHLEIATTALQHLNSRNFRKKYFKFNKGEDTEGADEDQTSSVDQSLDKEPNAIANGVHEKTVDEASMPAAVPTEPESPLEPLPKPEADGEDAQATVSRTELVNGDSTKAYPEGDFAEEIDASVKEEIQAPINDNNPPDTDDLSDADSDIAFEEKEDNYYSGYGGAGEAYVRYEISHWQHHLQLAENLWTPAEWKGPVWAELWNSLDGFFNNESQAFRSWARLQTQSWNPRFGDFFRAEPALITPLHAAVCAGLRSLTAHLLERGADVHAKLRDGRQAIHIASGLDCRNEEDKKNKLEILKLLLVAGADPNMASEPFSPTTYLVFAEPEVDHVQLFLKHGADFCKADDFGCSAVHRAAQYIDKLEVLKAIVDSVPDINIQDSRGETPLHNLLQRRHVDMEMLQYFIEKGADVNAEDKESQRPLQELAFNADTKLIEALLDAGADIHDDDVNGLTALHVAAQAGHKDATRVLVERDADIARQDQMGRTPFFLACQSGNPETAMYLLQASEEKGFNVANQVSKSGKSPLKKAAARGLIEMVERLLENADVKEKINDQDSKFRRTPLHSAAYNGHKDMVKLLIDHGARLDLEDKTGFNPLTFCAHGWMASNSDKHEATLLALIEEQPEEAAKDANLLNAAAINGSLLVINKLLDLNADPNQRDEEGWTAQQLARQYGRTEAVKLLERRNIVSGLKPTKWAVTQSNFVRVSEDGLQLEHINPEQAKDAPYVNCNVSFASDHAIPAGVEKYYYEISVEWTSEENKNPWISVGLAQKPTKLSKWMPGFKNEGSPGAASWGYHGDDGRVYRYQVPDTAPVNCLPPGMYGLGDTVGVAVDFLQKNIFYTKNGERLMDYAFNKVGGRLHPVVGLADKARITVNFGTDLEKNPFKWKPGNTLDFDADISMPKLKRTKTNGL